MCSSQVNGVGIPDHRLQLQGQFGVTFAKQHQFIVWTVSLHCKYLGEGRKARRRKRLSLNRRPEWASPVTKVETPRIQPWGLPCQLHNTCATDIFVWMSIVDFQGTNGSFRGQRCLSAHLAWGIPGQTVSRVFGCSPLSVCNMLLCVTKLQVEHACVSLTTHAWKERTDNFLVKERGRFLKLEDVDWHLSLTDHCDIGKSFSCTHLPIGVREWSWQWFVTLTQHVVRCLEQSRCFINGKSWKCNREAVSQRLPRGPGSQLCPWFSCLLQHSLYCTMLTDNRNYTGTYFSHMQNKSNKSCQMFLFHRRMKLMAVHQGSNLRFKEGLLNVSSHKNCPARYFSIPGLPKPLFGHIWSPSVLKCYINIRPV